MKKLNFQYQVALQFDTPVRNHAFSLRFVPQSDNVQEIRIKKMYVEPACSLDEIRDGFGNRLFVGRCDWEHDSFAYGVRGTAVIEQRKQKPSICHGMYRQQTKLTTWGPALDAFRDQFGLSGDSAVGQASMLMQKLYDTFEYVPGSTGIHTTAEEALAQRKGVCQDYAHILIALCRHEGIPARYVAGLMIGEGETHAWMEIYDGEKWVGLDPTHNRYVDDVYIKFSCGRDYEDCVIDKGVFTTAGAGGQKQNIYANVEEIS